VVIVSIRWSVVKCCLGCSCLASVCMVDNEALWGKVCRMLIVVGGVLFWRRLPLCSSASVMMVISLVVGVEFRRVDTKSRVQGWINWSRSMVEGG
jgi:hypothetical protein